MLSFNQTRLTPLRRRPNLPSLHFGACNGTHRTGFTPRPASLGLAWVVWLLALLIGFGWTAEQAFGEQEQALTSNQLTTGQLDAEIQRLEANSALEETAKTAALELLQRAREQVEAGEQHRDLADKFSAASRAIPLELQNLKSTAPPDSGAVPMPDQAALETKTASELRNTWLQKQAELAAQESKLREAEERLAARESELENARQRLTEVQREAEDLKLQLDRDADNGEPSTINAARKRLLESRIQALSLENRKLTQQIATHPLRFELLRVKRKRLEADVNAQRQAVQLLTEILNKRQLSDAQAEANKAAAVQREAAGKHPLLAQLAERNTALGKTLRAVAVEQERVSSETAQIVEATKRLNEEFDSTRKQIEIAGLSQVLGQALRERRMSLPGVKTYRKRAQAHENLIADTGLRQIEYRDELRELASIDAYVDQLIATEPTALSAPLREELVSLASNRQDLLQKAIAAQENYVRSLTQLDFQVQGILETTEAYDDYLGERLLWVRSRPALDLDRLLNAPHSLAEILAPNNWLGVIKALLAEVLRMPLWLLPMLIAAGLFAQRKPMLARLKATSDYLNKPTTDRFAFTWQAVGLTLLLASAWPVLLMTFGSALGFGLESDLFATAVGHSLVWLVKPVFLFETARMLCHPHGLGAAHFRWPGDSLRFLRREMLGLMAILVPLGGLTIITAEVGQSDTSIILPFMALELVLAWFLYRIMRPKGPVLRSFTKKNATRLLVRLRFIWFPLVVIIPITLAIAVARGFTFTAGELTSDFVDSLWFILALVVTYAIAARWLLMTRRRIAYESALERHEAAKRELEAAEGEKGELAKLVGEVEVPHVDITALDLGTRKLLSLGMLLAAVTGFALIWSDILPALNILERVELWSQTVTEGDVERLEPVTLADLALAIAIGLITAVLARNLPPFIEVVVLQRLGTSPGSRYAVSTLLGYVIAAIGAVLAVNTIGANWSKLQWLIAALGVGIGFGLQEIVANFISGLIILFERPIRVGDVVTVGDTNGVVTRIQIRATTIRGWDKKELLVPNKEFITGRLLNWSLSDQENRVLIKVGIAYGSDVELALRLLTEAAEDNERVLDDPKPLVVFENFGDSALDLSLRCYLASLDYRLAVTSELNLAINRKFAAAGIQIPFPQRDVHLSADEPLAVRLAGDHAQAPGGQGPAPT